MSKQSRSPTLREYIDSYQQLRRAKSNGNMLSAEKIPVINKPTAEMEVQVNELLQSIKKLVPKNQPSSALCISEQLYELTKMINQVFRKLKKLQGIDGTINSRTSNFASSVSAFENKPNLSKRNSVEHDSIINIPVVEVKEQLISPQILSKRIKFSNDLTSVTGSTTTQDMTPRNMNKQRKQNNEKKESTENYFKREITRAESMYRKQSHDNEDEMREVNNYRIIVPDHQPV